MKKLSLLILFILLYILAFGQQSITILDPKGNKEITALIYEYDSEETSEGDSIAQYWIDSTGVSVKKVGYADNRYNCHGYAWHMSENKGDTVNIQYERFGASNLEKYWSNPNQSYKSCSSSDASKIFYENTNGKHHSAKATNHEDTVISKWGNGGLYKHEKKDCPYYFGTNETELKYYKLNPKIIGSTSNLYINDNRQFTHDIDSLDVGCAWSKNSVLDTVSGQKSDTFTVKGKYCGQADIDLEVETPSESVVNAVQKNFSVELNTSEVEISGDDLVCYPAYSTYSLNSSLNHLDRTWSHSVNMETTSSSTDITYTVRALSGDTCGPGEIQVEIGNGCNHEEEKDVKVYRPCENDVDITSSGGGCMYPDSYYYVTASFPGGYQLTDYDWYITGGTILSGQGTTQIYIRTAKSWYSGTWVGVKPYNSCCETGLYMYNRLWYPCGRGFMMIPNPADESVEIKLNDEMVKDLKGVTLVVRSSYGTTMYNKNLTSTATMISTSDWDGGIYFVELWSDGKSYRQKLMISH